MISLKEAVELIDSCDDPNNPNPQVLEFMDGVDKAGMNVLKGKENEYLLNAIRILHGLSLTAIISNSTDMTDVMTCMALIGSPTYKKLVTVIFKFSVGLAAMDELR